MRRRSSWPDWDHFPCSLYEQGHPCVQGEQCKTTAWCWTGNPSPAGTQEGSGPDRAIPESCVNICLCGEFSLEWSPFSPLVYKTRLWDYFGGILGHFLASRIRMAADGSNQPQVSSPGSLFTHFQALKPGVRGNLNPLWSLEPLLPTELSMYVGYRHPPL